MLTNDRLELEDWVYKQPAEKMLRAWEYRHFRDKQAEHIRKMAAKGLS